MDFYQTDNLAAQQVFQTARIKPTEIPSYKVSYSHHGIPKDASSISIKNQFIDQPPNFTNEIISNDIALDSLASPVLTFGKNEKSIRSLIQDSYRLRHQVFAEELKWDVVSYNGREVDYYDLMNPYYAILNDDAGRVIGTWRALPTTSGYMLKDIFPELCRGEAAPVMDDVWEISRFAIDKITEQLKYTNEGVCEPVQTLVDSFSKFAKKKNIQALVAVTSTAGERMLKRLGLKVRRFGDGKSMKIGKVNSTAIWIEVN